MYHDQQGTIAETSRMNQKLLFTGILVNRESRFTLLGKVEFVYFLCSKPAAQNGLIAEYLQERHHKLMASSR
jgi:hypothetical protein